MPKLKEALDKAASVVDAAADKARDKARDKVRRRVSSSHAEPLTFSRAESTALRAPSQTLAESRTAADDPVAAALIEDLMVRK